MILKFVSIFLIGGTLLWMPIIMSKVVFCEEINVSPEGNQITARSILEEVQDGCRQAGNFEIIKFCQYLVYRLSHPKIDYSSRQIRNSKRQPDLSLSTSMFLPKMGGNNGQDSIRQLLSEDALYGVGNGNNHFEDINQSRWTPMRG